MVIVRLKFKLKLVLGFFSVWVSLFSKYFRTNSEAESECDTNSEWVRQWLWMSDTRTGSGWVEISYFVIWIWNDSNLVSVSKSFWSPIGKPILIHVAHRHADTDSDTHSLSFKSNSNSKLIVILKLTRSDHYTGPP